MSRRNVFPVVFGTLSVLAIFCEGILDTPWLAWFQADDSVILARPKLVLLFVIPIVACLVLPKLRWIRVLLTMLGMGLLTLVGFDLGLRFLYPYPAALPQVVLPRLPNLPRWPANVRVHGNSFGDLAGMAGDRAVRENRFVRFETDRLGFRNASSSKPIDVVVLGDSFGAGLGTTQDSIFPVRLARMTGKRVYSLSFPANPYSEYLNLLAERTSLQLQENAHVVWVLFTGNDLFDVHPNLGWDPSTLPWRTGVRAWTVKYRNFRNLSPIRALLLAAHGALFGPSSPEMPIRRALPNGLPILFRDWYRREVNLDQDQAEAHPHFPIIERTIREMAARVQDWGLSLTIVVIPAKEEVYRWILEERSRRGSDRLDSGFAQALFAACGRAHVRCLNTKPAILDEAYRLYDAASELLYWRDDTHLNNHGHAVVASFIADSVFLDTTPSNDDSPPP